MKARNKLNRKVERQQKTNRLMTSLKQDYRNEQDLRNQANNAARQQKIKSMQNEIMAQGAVNDMVDNAVNQSSATKIQSAVRNRNARKEVKQQKVANNIAKLSKGATDDLKERWKQSIQQQQTSISNFGQLTQGLKQQQHQQRMGIASMQPTQLQTGKLRFMPLRKIRQ